MVLFLALENKRKTRGWFLKRQNLTLITSEPVICHVVAAIHLSRRRSSWHAPCSLSQLSSCLRDKLLWVNYAGQWSTTQPLIHSPRGMGRESEGQKLEKSWQTLVKCSLHQQFGCRSAEQGCCWWGYRRVGLHLRPKSWDHRFKARGEITSQKISCGLALNDLNLRLFIAVLFYLPKYLLIIKL